MIKVAVIARLSPTPAIATDLVPALSISSFEHTWTGSGPENKLCWDFKHLDFVHDIVKVYQLSFFPCSLGDCDFSSCCCSFLESNPSEKTLGPILSEFDQFKSFVITSLDQSCSNCDGVGKRDLSSTVS